VRNVENRGGREDKREWERRRGERSEEGGEWERRRGERSEEGGEWERRRGERSEEGGEKGREGRKEKQEKNLLIARWVEGQTVDWTEMSVHSAKLLGENQVIEPCLEFTILLRCLCYLHGFLTTTDHHLRHTA